MGSSLQTIIQGDAKAVSGKFMGDDNVKIG